MIFVACQHEDNRLLETSHESVEEACSKAVEPLVNGCSSSIYQMITNADGTLSLVSLDAAQLDQLLNIQGTTHSVLSVSQLLIGNFSRMSKLLCNSRGVNNSFVLELTLLSAAVDSDLI